MRYVAPEQITGADLDRRVDVWAVGVSLWETLTGRFLFQAKGAVPTLRAVRDQAIDPPSTGNPSVPAALDRAVMNALRRDRESRTATAAQMAAALRSVIREIGIPTDPATRAQWMAWEFAAEIADYERLRQAVLSREPAAGSNFQSGMRVKTQLVSMAEIIPCDDTDEITDVEVVPPLAVAETRIFDSPPSREESTPIRGPSAPRPPAGVGPSPALVLTATLLLWMAVLLTAAIVGIMLGL
jgi:serine/threonine-protein kinase